MIFITKLFILILYFYSHTEINHMRKEMKSIKILTVFFLVILISNISAQQSIYLGGNIGTAFVKKTVEDLEGIGISNFQFDENNFAYKLFAGYKLNRFLSVEGGYRNTGKAENEKDGYTLSSTTTGWDVEAVGIFNLEYYFVFAKAGAFFWNTENEAGELINSEDSTGFLWGLGAGINLGGLAVRAEWESLGTDNPETLSMLTFGVTFGF